MQVYPGWRSTQEALKDFEGIRESLSSTLERYRNFRDKYGLSFTDAKFRVYSAGDGVEVPSDIPQYGALFEDRCSKPEYGGRQTKYWVSSYGEVGLYELDGSCIIAEMNRNLVEVESDLNSGRIESLSLAWNSYRYLIQRHVILTKGLDRFESIGDAPASTPKLRIIPPATRRMRRVQ